jgi:hypothetical protein
MQKIDLYPDSTNCIETVARQEYSGVFKELITPGRENHRLEEKLEILRLFLETADFKKLRVESEKELAEGKQVKFTIYLNDKLNYEMQVI